MRKKEREGVRTGEGILQVKDQFLITSPETSDIVAFRGKNVISQNLHEILNL